MIRFRKQVLIFISILIVLSIPLVIVEKVSADGLENEDIEVIVNGNPITSKAAIVMDFTTGLVIFEHNADELRIPASMAKMVAVHVLFDTIKASYISLETFIQPSAAVSAFSFDRYWSNVPMPVNSYFTVRELLDAVIVRSACAATVALGESIFGSEEALVSKMNEKVAQLGIEAYFYDSWGGSPENRVSARGMAELTRALIREHPEILGITSQHTIMFDDVEYRSTNPLLTEYEGVDGFKTGYTNPAGWCFTGTALIDGRRLITVTMGSVQGFRFPDSVILLDYGFANFDKTVANHFRSSIKPLDLYNTINSSLVPIMMFKIEESQYFDLRYLALILNEYNIHTQA